MPVPLFQKTAKLVIISKMFLYKVFIVFFFNFLCTCPYILSFLALWMVVGGSPFYLSL